ncbi:hypothetical protein [Congregibacter litoralis]|uniref:Uncharacterized protein n=1 Tax=Congregibacter litoralis KT71 TaxID=314285 RepID=A4AAE0_9GAMM|nr:hypothetical protein [Congregibacter litoralis]EAQ97017.1 hypothetical protein KT71_12180 [Congregibacter litoralis KT71]
MDQIELQIVSKEVFGELAAHIEHGINRVLEKYQDSTRSRKLRIFRRFQELAESDYGFVSEENVQQILGHFRDRVYTHRGNTVTITADSDYRAFRRLIADLVQIQCFPKCRAPQPLNSSSPLLDETRILNCLGTMDPCKWRSDNQKASRTTLYAVSDQDYLNQFFEHQHAVRDEFLRLARHYIAEAANRFALGREFLRETDQSIFDDPMLLSQNGIPGHRGQRCSLFSKDLPDNEGLRNLVAFLHFKRNGLLTRDFAGANNHLYKFGGRTELSEYLGLSSDLAAACAVIVIDETGINPQSFYRMEYDPGHRTITPHDTLDGYYFSYVKLRAGGPKNRLIPRSDHKINAEYCFSLIASMTEAHREIASPDTGTRLLIHDGCHTEGEIHAISDTALKNGVRRLVARSKSESFIESGPNLKKLRVSRGLLEWYNSGGNPRAAARYLGNSVNVTITNYIPKELQEFIYRKQIRQFQHLLIAVSTDEQPYQMRALNISSSRELANYLESQVEESALYSRLKASKVDQIKGRPSSEVAITFVLSAQNIAFLDAAKKNYMDGTASMETKCLQKWAQFCGMVFSYIQSHGTRSQKIIMAEGISLSSSSPLQLQA